MAAQAQSNREAMERELDSYASRLELASDDASNGLFRTFPIALSIADMDTDDFVRSQAKGRCRHRTAR